MNKFIEKPNTHIVIKREDVLTLITAEEALQLANIMQKIEDKRFELGKKIRQSYYVVNHDEFYSQEVFEVIKAGEIHKEKAVFDEELRFCKVCGCSADHSCPGGCYWVTDNLCSNCVYSIFTCEAIVLEESTKDELNTATVPGTEDYLADEITDEMIARGYIYGHAAGLDIDTSTDGDAHDPGDRVRIYQIFQHGEILTAFTFSLEPKNE